MTPTTSGRSSVRSLLPDTPGEPVVMALQRKNPIVYHGDLLREHALVGAKLKSLAQDEHALHGNLQVIFSALSRMQQIVKRLIEMEQSL